MRRPTHPIFIICADVNGARSVRHARTDKLLGTVRPDGFEPTAFTGEWGMDRTGVRFTFIMALLQGRIIDGVDGAGS